MTMTRARAAAALYMLLSCQSLLGSGGARIEELAARGGKSGALGPTFDDMGLKDLLLRGIFAYGLELPNSVQQQTIQPIMAHRDVIAEAAPGRGTAAAFLIAAMQMIDPSEKRAQVLVVTPTSARAQEVMNVAEALGEMSPLAIHMCGGTWNAAQLVIGAPDCLNPLIQPRSLNIGGLKLLVVDKADEVLRGGLGPLYPPIRNSPPKVPVALFAAELIPAVKEFARLFMHDPVSIAAGEPELSLDGVKQFYFLVEPEDPDPVESKLESLMNAEEVAGGFDRAIIYVGSRSTLDRVAERFNCAVVHGGMVQAERDKVMRGVRGGSRLCSTDLPGGPDTEGPGLPIVINFDMPPDAETYLRRAGRAKVAITLVTDEDTAMLAHLAETYHGISEMPYNIGNLV